MPHRWLEGNVRLDTSRGSRFMARHEDEYDAEVLASGSTAHASLVTDGTVQLSLEIVAEDESDRVTDPVTVIQR